MSTERSNAAKETVLNAVTKLFIEQDPAAVENHFGPAYTQHSTHDGVVDGVEGLARLARDLPPGFRYEPVRILAEDGLVVLHGVYTGVDAEPLIAFDVYRAEAGRDVEHWDSLTPQVRNTLSGRTQIDGPTEPTDLAYTAANKALVSEFVERVLIDGDSSVVTDYISGEGYLQHNPEIGDGLDGFLVAVGRWAEQGKIATYRKVHQLIAEGDFVFTRSEGEFGQPVVFNDLWRVKDGKITEHWDVIGPIPAETSHGNSPF
jgi:predicted SnoaL-like aldol condensation-catalyzing enzyme